MIMQKYLRQALEPTIEAAKRLWEELKRLGGFAWEGLKDFYHSFLVPVGQWILGEGLPRFLDIITNGLAKIDWQKINDALHKLWQALTPFAINIGKGLLWCLENVLVPLGVWAMNKIVPLLIEAIAAAFGILNGILEALKPLGVWLWEAFLQPLAQWTGGIIVSVLEALVGILQRISDWIGNNQGLVQAMAITVGAFFAAWQLTTLSEFVINAGGVTGALGKVSAALVASTAAKIADKLETAKLALMYGKDLAVSLITNIANLAKEAAAWIASTAAKAANTIAQTAQTAATVVWNGVCTLATTLTTAFGVAVNFLTGPIGLVIAAIAALVAGIVLLVQNWDTVKETAQNVWNAIVTQWQSFASWFEEKVWAPFKKGLTATKNFFIDVINGMISGFEGFVNFLLSGINKVIDGLNKISSALPGGGFQISNIPPIKLGRVPKLATGAVIPPNQEFLAVLGDQKQGRNFEAPEGLLRQIVREESGGKEPQGGSPIEVVLNLDGKTLARILVPYMEQANRQRGTTLIRGVTG